LEWGSSIVKSSLTNDKPHSTRRQYWLLPSPSNMKRRVIVQTCGIISSKPIITCII
jgi:hypothetical protein